MSTVNLSRIFNPESIAVIGTSEKKGPVGEAIMRNIIFNGFQGEILPVNQNHQEVMGIPAFHNVKDISKKIDLAIIATPLNITHEIVESCGKVGIAGAVIMSSGGKEIGKKGQKLEARIMENARKYNLRIIGPNCVGIINTEKRLNASLMQQFPLPGKIAFLSQSGAVCSSVLDFAMRENVGFSHLVSLGSMADINFADMIEYLGSLSSVESIAMYMENSTNIKNFMNAARSVSRQKPIITLKSGRSKSGVQAAASHTGAMAGVDTAYDAAFKRAGILRVDEFEELFDCAEFLAKQTRPKGGRLAIVTNAGGPGVMAVDALSSHGLEPAELTNETIKKIDSALMKEWCRANPIDVLENVSPEQYLKVVDICCKADEIDGLLLICSPVGTVDLIDLAKSLVEYLKDRRCPIFASWIGGTNIEPSRTIFNKGGIATYDTPERAVRAFAHLYQYGQDINILHEISVQKDKKPQAEGQTIRKVLEKTLTTSQDFDNEIEAKKTLRIQRSFY